MSSTVFKSGSAFSVGFSHPLRRYRRRSLAYRVASVARSGKTQSALIGALSLLALLSVIGIGALVKAGIGPSIKEFEDDALLRKLTVTLEQSNARALALSRISNQAKLHRESLTHFISEIIVRHRGAKSTLSLHQARSTAQAIVRESQRIGFDPLMVAAIIKNESTFNPEARSKVGAVGLMQVLPSTGDFVSRFSGIARSSQTPLNDPVHNIRIGLAYLAYLRSMFRNDHQKMLIAYNWGPENYRRSQRGLSTVPESSRTYARKILAHYRDSQRVFQSLAPRYRHFDLERAWAKNASPSIKQDSLPSVG